jgi:pimeloyl-ACP methyl ester carboxylesterase
LDSTQLIGLVATAVLLIVLSLFLVPTSVGGLESRPNPLQHYDDAVKRFEAQAEIEQTKCFPLGRSLLLAHGQRTPLAFVLIHGLTNSPHQFEEFGQLLWSRGHNVLVPRMPFHGHNSARLREIWPLRAEDLRDYADETVDLAAGLGEEIIVVGVSGGGTVAAWIGQNRPEVSQVVSIAPFLGAPGKARPVGNLLMNACCRLPSIDLTNPKEPPRTWVYRGQSTRPLAQTVRLGKAMYEQAAAYPPAAGRIIVLTAAGDNQVDNVATQRLVKLWRQGGGNVIAYEFSREAALPHNPIDPTADPAKRQLAYQTILELLGLPIEMA